MDLIIFIVIVIVLLALGVYAVRQVGLIEPNFQGLIIALLVLLAIAAIAHRAGIF